jgi:hypothetical protein
MVADEKAPNFLAKEVLLLCDVKFSSFFEILLPFYYKMNETKVYFYFK